jgi:hypothetical protein
MIPNVPQKHFGFGDLFMAVKINKGVCHTMALPFTFKKYLKEKKRIMETQIFHHAKIESSKNPLKETKSFKIL